MFASSLALVSISFTITAVSCFTSSSTVFKRYSFACSEVKPEILSSSCTLLELSSSTSCLLRLSSSSLRPRFASRRSAASSFLSKVSSFARTRRSYFWTSARLSLVSLSSSFLVLMDSSFTSKRASFFLVSAVLRASSIISLALSSALPIFFSITLRLYALATNQVIGATIILVITIAKIVCNTGAPPYLVFIVQNTTFKLYTFLAFVSSVD